MIIQILAYIGASALALAPFIIANTSGQIIALTGLAMLIPQAVKLKAHNLVILNTLGIIGYLFTLFRV